MPRRGRDSIGLFSSPRMRSLTAFTRAWYAQELLRELVLIYPVYAIMIGRAGVTPLELSILLAAWSGTAVLCEVPTGTLADRLPRRWILVAGQLLKAGCFLLWWLWPTFGGFLFGFVAWGIGGSLRSGAAEALLHDALRARSRPELFVQLYGRSEAVGAASVTLAMFLGGWAAATGFALPLVLSVAAPLAAALVTVVFVDEPPRDPETARHDPYLATLEAGWHEATGSASLRRPILYLCTAALVYEVGEEFFGPLLDEIGFSLAAVGMINALANLARAGGALAAARLDALVRGRVFVLYVLGGALLAFAALGRGWPSVAALAAFVALAAAAKVVLQGRLQLGIEGRARATVTSIAGLGQDLFGLPLYLALGAIAAASTWSISFVGLAVGLIVVALAFGFTGSSRRR